MMFYQAPWQKRLESLGYCQVFGLSTAGAVLAGSGLSSAGSLAGGKKASNAASQASAAQVAAEQQALQLQASIYANNQNELQPFINFGQAYLGPLDTTIGNILRGGGFQPTQTQLSQMPGYQFVQNQTQQAVTNAGSVTGPSGATNYQKMVQGAGVASTYEQQFFNQWLQNNQLQLTAAATPVQTGLSAAGALAGVGVASGANMANTLGNIGASQASGIVGSANALTAGLTGATNAVGGGIGNAAMLGLLGGNQGTGISDTALAQMADQVTGVQNA